MEKSTETDEAARRWTPTPGDGWRAVADEDLRVEPGSALDFANLVFGPQSAATTPVRANAQGQLISADGERRRFFCAVYNYAGPNGGFPDHAEAEELAIDLRRNGYNLLRVHMLDNTLFNDAAEDFEYDAEQLDRFHFLLSVLKEQGIYWMIDAATSRHGAYAVEGSRWSSDENHLQLDVHYKPDVQEHWREMVRTLLARKNPYTGLSVLQDPALLAVTLVNEGGVRFNLNPGKTGQSTKAFNDWVAANFRAKSMGDRMRAYTQIERSTIEWMSAHLRQLGFKGFVTGFNNGKRVQSRVASNDFNLVSLHAYFDHPKKFIREGNHQEGNSSIPELLPYVRYLATSRYAGRPFIVDEYDHPFWSAWRREAGMLVPAYAAFQDWDAICRYSNPVQLHYGRSEATRHQAIYPFSIGMDPIARAGETLAALLFRRGDVRVADHQVAVDLTPFYVYRRGGGERLMPEYASRVALHHAVGLRWRGKGTDLESMAWQPDISFSVMPRWRLRHPPGLMRKDQSEPTPGVYRTDTDEITIDANVRGATVVTRQTEATAFDDALPVKLPHLEVNEASGPAMVSLSALDEQGLNDSRRLLLIYATDALNSDIVFQDAHRNSVLELGRLPVLINTGRVRVTLRHARAKDLRLYALGLNGARRESIAVQQVPGGITFALDTAELEHGPTTYFELVVEDA